MELSSPKMTKLAQKAALAPASRVNIVIRTFDILRNSESLQAPFEQCPRLA
jgi:hypothetical protein